MRMDEDEEFRKWWLEVGSKKLNDKAIYNIIQEAWKAGRKTGENIKILYTYEDAVADMKECEGVEECINRFLIIRKIYGRL